MCVSFIQLHLYHLDAITRYFPIYFFHLCVFCQVIRVLFAFFSSSVNHEKLVALRDISTAAWKTLRIDEYPWEAINKRDKYEYNDRKFVLIAHTIVTTIKIKSFSNLY